MPRVYGGGNKCSRCKKTVYQTEEVTALGEPFHMRQCFTCELCNKSLNSTNLAERKPIEGTRVELYCKNCYGKQFGPKGYGYGVGSGTFQYTSA